MARNIWVQKHKQEQLLGKGLGHPCPGKWKAGSAWKWETGKAGDKHLLLQQLKIIKIMIHIPKLKVPGCLLQVKEVRLLQEPQQPFCCTCCLE